MLEAWKQYHQQTANQVSESESRQSDSPSERFSNKLGKINQIADKDSSGQQVNPES